MSGENDVRRALGDRPVVIETPYVASHGCDSSPETDVRDQSWVVLALDGSGAHFPHAQTWNHTKLAKEADPALFMAQFMILFVEYSSQLGSVRPTCTDGEEYQNLVRLAARVQLGNASPEERARLKHGVVCDSKVSLKFLHDVKEQAKCEAHSQKQKKDAHSQKKKREREEEEGEKGVRRRKVVPAKPPLPAKPIDAAWVRTGAMAAAENAAIILQHRRYRAECAYVDSEVPALEGEKEEAPRREEWKGERDLVSKVQMTLTAVPRAGGNPRNPEDIVALLLRFLVRDPALNAGHFVQAVIKNAASRSKPKARGGMQRGADEMFPQYAPLYASNHPVGSSTTDQTYFLAALGYDPTLESLAANRNLLYQMMNAGAYKNHFHPSSLLSWAAAKRHLERLGGGNLYELDWFDHETHTATFPAEDGWLTYKYISEGVFWYNPRYVGLAEHLFPYVSQDQDFLLQLVGSDPRSFEFDDEGNWLKANDLARVSGVMQEIHRMISTSWLVERSKVLDKRLVAYRTNNEFIHRYAEATLIDNKLRRVLPAHWRQTYADVELVEREGAPVDVELGARMDECRQYASLRRRAADACMRVFKTLWVTEGNIDELPVPDSIKAVQRWYRDNSGRFPHLTREYMMWDPEMGLFSNAILRLMGFYSKVATIVHPVICILAIGLLSCHHQGRGLGFNMLGHGWHATGKTKTAINTFQDYTAIPGTTMEYCTATGASDTTHRHMYDVVILNDEVASWKVDPLAAEKFSDLANKAKVKMVDNKLGHYVFKSVTLDDTTQVRWSDLITTDHFVTLVEVTNREVSARDALASRYYRFTMPLPKIPIHQLNGKVDDNIKDDVKTFMRIGHYLMACGMKCATVGGMLPEPDKEVWNALNSRVLDYLHGCKAISDDMGQRELDIMWPLVRQYIYMWAVHCAFDMPGAPNYKKRFEVDMIREIEPYLYCTTEIWWFGWTALASQWVDDNNSKFARAFDELTNYSRVREKIPLEQRTNSSYCVFEHDTSNEVKFLVTLVPGAQPEDKAHDNHRQVNLNYVFIPGTLESVAQAISSMSKAQGGNLTTTDCHGIIKVLSKHMIRPPSGVYQEVKNGMAREFHRRVNGRKKVDTLNTAFMDKELLWRNADKTQERTEDDVPRQGDNVTIPAVQIRADGICMIPGIADLFRSDIVTKALVYASMNSQFPEGKMLTGIPCESTSQMLDSKFFTRELIDDAVQQLDAMDPGGVSRTEGVTFNRRVGISGADRSFFTACPTVPTEGEDWLGRAEASMDSMSELRQTIFDLDYEAALRQHVFSGRRFEDPVMTPTYIRNRYEKACAQLKREASAQRDYPYDWEEEQQRNETMWRASAPTTRIQAWTNLVVDKLSSAAHVPRKKRLRNE